MFSFFFFFFDNRIIIGDIIYLLSYLGHLKIINNKKIKNLK